MSIFDQRFKKALRKKARRGHRGYPMASVIFYGPDDKRASKLVGYTPAQGSGVTELKRWFSDSGDVRRDAAILKEALEFIQSHDVRTVVMNEGIFGCPHEEEIDYPEGEVCPQCPFWAYHDRYTGRVTQ
jgi:hypothetical protein